MNKAIVVFSIFFICQQSLAAFANYNSILIGERAAGMGGAYTALSGDPSACSFYNPANLARMEGTTLSAAINVYNKYETRFGDDDDFASAPLRVHQGSFIPVPTSSGSVYTFRNFAFGLSILVPDFQTYNGEVRSLGENVSLLNIEDKSLWVGGTIALNFTENLSLGLTMYYTSRNYSRSVVDRVEQGQVTRLTNIEKTLTNNSLIYVLGTAYQISPRWKLGFSHRFSSLEISGHGTYFSTHVATDGGLEGSNRNRLLSETRVPSKTTVGLAYEKENDQTWSLDVSYYGSEDYFDLEGIYGDRIINKPIINLNIGGEYYVKEWLSFRGGIYTNFSSAPHISEFANSWQQERINMWGFSANIAIFTSPNSSITLGGYYTGGKGHSTQYISEKIERITTSSQTFTLLVGTTFRL